jgi:hypothetical protein
VNDVQSEVVRVGEVYLLGGVVGGRHRLALWGGTERVEVLWVARACAPPLVRPSMLHQSFRGGGGRAPSPAVR